MMLYHFIMPLIKDTVKFENHLLQYSKQKVKFLCYDIFKRTPFTKSDKVNFEELKTLAN